MKRSAIFFLAALILVVPVAGVARLFLAGGEDDRAGVSLARVRSEGVVYVESEGVFVVWTGDEPLALAAASPHLSHRLLFCRSSGLFEGEHGEKFDRRGIYFGGPAPRGMDRVGIEVLGDRVLIDPDALGRGPGRGALAAEEPEGRFCLFGSESAEIVESPPGFAPDPGDG
jgi:hypothetical protein